MLLSTSFITCTKKNITDQYTVYLKSSILPEMIKTFRCFFCINRGHQNIFKIQTELESDQRGKSTEADTVFPIRSIISLDWGGFLRNNKKSDFTFAFTWAAWYIMIEVQIPFKFLCRCVSSMYSEDISRTQQYTQVFSSGSYLVRHSDVNWGVSKRLHKISTSYLF